ncbi:MAG: Calx-beta domain-containing protein [Acidobacteriota bacterium]
MWRQVLLMIVCGIICSAQVYAQSPLTVQFSSASYSVSEDGKTATITVTLTGDGLDGSLTVDYATTNGSATAGVDYITSTGTVTFTDQGSQTFTVPIIDDNLLEENETVNLVLSNPTQRAGLGSPSTAVLTIIDNDLAPPQLAVEPTTFDFGQVLTGESRTLSFTISNIGGSNAAPLQITDVTAETLQGLNGFEISPLPTTQILAGGNVQMSITFAPQEIDPLTGSVAEIRILSNAGAPLTLTARGRGIVRLGFATTGGLRVREEQVVSTTLILQGRPPATGLTVTLEPRFDSNVLDLTLNQNLARLLRFQQEVASAANLVFTQANEQRTIRFTIPELEIGPSAEFTLALAAGNNPALELVPLRVVLRPNNNPDLLKTFNCQGCQAGFTQEDDLLTVVIAYFDHNRNVGSLLLVLRNEQRATFTLPAITPETSPALPTDSRGFAIRLKIRGARSFGQVQAIEIFLRDGDNNLTHATLPDTGVANIDNLSLPLSLPSQYKIELEIVEIITHY